MNCGVKKKKISRLEACIFFVKNLKNVKFITIGFDSDMELKQILKGFKLKKKFYFKQSNVINNQLIDPRKW